MWWVIAYNHDEQSVRMLEMRGSKQKASAIEEKTVGGQHEDRRSG